MTTNRGDRQYGETTRDKDDRDPYQHDRDRIIYSTAFRRLGRVTQVVSPTERQLLHNRLTHSLEVAQIARGLAFTLLKQENVESVIQQAGGLSADVVEAASLAHDLGHPPFGHVAEHELDVLLREKHLADGFEGNAQSFRIVTKLSTRHLTCDGLNLTRATLCSLLKYPWTRGEEGKRATKWGAYSTEREILDWARDMMPFPDGVRSLEAALMDWADDIAYAVHDLEDFFRSGIIPFDRLATDESEKSRFKRGQIGQIAADLGEPLERIESAFDELMQIAPLLTPYQGTKKERALLRSFTSSLIHRYINSVSVMPDGIGDQILSIETNARMEVAILKRLTWHYVIDSQPLTTQRFGQRSLIRSLFHVYYDSAMNERDWAVFPAFYREKLELGASYEERVRIVADVISSMNEAQAIEMNERLTGQSLGSALDRPQN